jgi:hypothetical protein
VTPTPEPDHRSWLIGTAHATDIACAPLGLPAESIHPGEDR